MSLSLAIYIGLGLISITWMLVGMMWCITGERLYGPWSEQGRTFTLPFLCWMGGGLLGLLLWRLTTS